MSIQNNPPRAGANGGSMNRNRLPPIIGLLSLLSAAWLSSAGAATIVVDELFPNPSDPAVLTLVPAPGTPSAPSGWTQVSRFGSSTVTLQSGGSLNIAMGASGVTAIYENNNTFDPTVAGTTVTLKTSVVSLSATGTARNITAFGTISGAAIANIGWNLSPTGQFGVGAQVDGVNDIPGCNSGAGRCTYFLGPLLTQVDSSPYGGGAIEVTAVFTSAGFRITTNTGYDSATDPNAVAGYIPYSTLNAALDFGDFVNSSHGSLGMVGTSGSSRFDRFQLITATGADATSVTSAQTVSTPVATTTLSISNTGAVDQTGGTTTVLQTMTVDAGGNYTLSGGTLDASTIDANGTFDFTGGTLSVDDFQGDLTNQGGTLSPGNSPGLTAITGDYDQQSAGALLIELAGLNAVSEYDQVQVSGTATLGGTLDVDLLYGFTPAMGDSFDILLAEVVQGTFGSTLFPSLPAGLVWNLQYLIDAIGSTDVVRLSVQEAVPVPGAVWLFGGALGALGWVRRRAKAA